MYQALGIRRRGVVSTWLGVGWAKLPWSGQAQHVSPSLRGKAKKPSVCDRQIFFVSAAGGGDCNTLVTSHAVKWSQVVNGVVPARRRNLQAPRLSLDL